jgi:hypothetical protein
MLIFVKNIFSQKNLNRLDFKLKKFHLLLTDILLYT